MLYIQLRLVQITDHDTIDRIDRSRDRDRIHTYAYLYTITKLIIDYVVDNNDTVPVTTRVLDIYLSATIAMYLIYLQSICSTVVQYSRSVGIGL